MLNETKLGCYSGDKLINYICYVDDTVLIAPSLNSNACIHFGNKYDILYNVKKTKFMIFEPKQYRCHSPKLLLYNKEIEKVDKFVYLGICISANDNEEIKIQYQNIFIQSNILLKKFSKCNNKIKILLF